MILIYAFSNRWGTNISRRVLSELEKTIVGASLADAQIDFIPINSYPQEFFRKYIHNNHYQLIIGLGDGGQFNHHIRIETQAKNSYNNRPIDDFQPILLDLNLPPVDNYDPSIFKISSNMGTYNCNWMAFKTQVEINSHSPHTFHLFLHLPPRINSSILAQSINHLFTVNDLIHREY